MEYFGNLIWLFFIFSALLPAIQRRMLDYARLQKFRELERRRGTRVITLIHRQETMSFLGIPIVRFINIEDSEAILQAIRLTPDDQPIDLVMHTPGGLVLASEQIAQALLRRTGRVTVLVPHYAMSGGTLIALAADEIIMDANAVLGPVDPQIGEFPAASIMRAAQVENPNRDDRTLILADIAQKALHQVYEVVVRLIVDKLPEERARELAQLLSQGTWTHDYPIDVEQLRQFGLPVSTELPREVYELMSLYPQPAQRRPSVEYVPMPYHPLPPEPQPAPPRSPQPSGRRPRGV
jgi:ClpP class serine protease